jgi:ATP-dependent DNA ligase
MIRYESFSYIYPPRPKNAVDPKEIDSWDDGAMVGQPKLNGSCCLVFTNGMDVYVYNRHNQRLTNFDLSKEEILNLYSGSGWMVIVGEYLNKSKKDENGETFNHKLCLFDILVHNSNYLVGETFESRIVLMDSLFGKKVSEKKYLYSVSENVYRIRTFGSGFRNLFDDLSVIDVVEGLVLKRKSSKLEIGTSENNNIKSQIKFRKPTKNYKY